MIQREEYERVCKENRELKAELRNIVSEIFKAGKKFDDRTRKDEGVGQD